MSTLSQRYAAGPVLGSIAGDTIGSVYEFDNIKTTDFPLFVRQSKFTDDSVMTLAVARALVDSYDGTTFSKSKLVDAMQDYGKRLPHAGYGRMFYRWLREKTPEPYNSYGNGSAMRVSPVAWVTDDVTHADERQKPRDRSRQYRFHAQTSRQERFLKGASIQGGHNVGEGSSLPLAHDMRVGIEFCSNSAQAFPPTAPENKFTA